VAGIKLRERLAQKVVMSPTVIPRSYHLPKVCKYVLIHPIEEGCDKLKELILVEYSFDIAIEAFHDLIV
jgi:hypothetical protein